MFLPFYRNSALGLNYMDLNFPAIMNYDLFGFVERGVFFSIFDLSFFYCYRGVFKLEIQALQAKIKLFKLKTQAFQALIKYISVLYQAFRLTMPSSRKFKLKFKLLKLKIHASHA